MKTLRWHDGIWANAYGSFPCGAYWIVTLGDWFAGRVYHKHEQFKIHIWDTLRMLAPTLDYVDSQDSSQSLSTLYAAT